ncbi:Uu.00g035110.m01.CDS01 [Anthostomella pinea]|uniref:Uu.00g035110.m01.CDS01 n=1 Tax=Anthostomella pinea TaxID=933095 RepID=A0AAI8YDK1_9PEZI|nr:Uu.00g035110.m01.CDS01 [Anthostomella pinea]
MERPTTAAWGIHINKADFDRLKKGVEPRDMDDKWQISADKPDAADITVVHMRRSWTGKEMFTLKIKGSDGGDGGGKIQEITWEVGPGDDPIEDEEWAKDLATGLYLKSAH